MRISTKQASAMTGIPQAVIPQLMHAGILPWGATMKAKKKITCYIEEERVRAWQTAKDISE